MRDGDWPVLEDTNDFNGEFAEDGTNSTVRDHTDLLVWQLAMDLAVEIYKITADFPREESYAMTSQLRRAAVSISSNIAEGYGRGTTGAYVQFLRIAQGSARETQSLVTLAERLGYIGAQAKNKTDDEIVRILKMLWSLMRAVEKKARR